MPRFMRRFTIGILLASILSSAVPCQAAAPVLSASAYVLMDADSGRVLLAQNETAEMAIASTTKIMTALVALEQSCLTDTVTVKREHLKEGSSMYLAEGERLTMEALLYGLMLPSGNDAAECIADWCGKGRERFVARMNEKASALDMAHTSFANPSGLDAEGHYSCAIDMARLMAYAMQNPTFAQIVSAESAMAGTRSMGNHNKLLGAFEGCIGGKTGYTNAAGRTLVTCVERDGMRLVAVTLHDSSDWDDHKALYEYGFSAYHNEQVIERGRGYALSAVRGGAVSYVRLCAAESLSYPLAEGETSTLRVEADETVSAPVKAGQRCGRIVFLLNDAELGSVDLLAAGDVAAVETERGTRTLAERLRTLWRTK